MRMRCNITAIVCKKRFKAFFDGLLAMKTGIIQNHWFNLKQALWAHKIMACLH